MIGCCVDIVYIEKLIVAFKSFAKNITILSHIKITQNTKIIKNLVIFKKSIVISYPVEILKSLSD